jgi:hypothetical protein
VLSRGSFWDKRIKGRKKRSKAFPDYLTPMLDGWNVKNSPINQYLHSNLSDRERKILPGMLV